MISIKSAEWADINKNTIRVTTDDNSVLFVPDDMLNSDRQQVESWKNKGNAISDYHEDGPAVVQNSISRRQFFQQLSVFGLISEDEAMDAVGSGKIPSEMLSVINTLPDGYKFSAKMKLAGATTFELNDSLVKVFAQAKNLSNFQLNQMWFEASQL